MFYGFVCACRKNPTTNQPNNQQKNNKTELPESLKALFRPITVVVPDRQLIMENMLMAEGFVEAKPLAKKFASLYYLLEDLLSPAKHYDWGLRAIKSVLVVAGSLLRAEAGQVRAGGELFVCWW